MVLRRVITAKEAQEMDMDERDSHMDYAVSINLIEYDLPMATHGKKDKSNPKENKTPQQQRTTVDKKVDEEERETDKEEERHKGC